MLVCCNYLLLSTLIPCCFNLQSVDGIHRTSCHDTMSSLCSIYMIYNVRHDFTLAVLGFIAVKGILDFVLTDYFLFRSVVLTSATTATVGLGLTIPMAFVADLIFSPEYVISIYSVFGAVAVGFGFISVTLSGDNGSVKQEEKEENTGIDVDPIASVCGQDDALATNFVLPAWAQT